jgi:membrane associated rhomboid family serine protease
MNIKYNSVLILTYFFISLVALILDKISKGKINKWLFSSYRNSLLSPLTYVRLVTHSIGHSGWNHFMNNFLYILLVGPMIEEKYGTIPLLKMMLISSLVIGIFNFIFSKKGIVGASGIVYMLITLSSSVNLEGGIPLTLILICLFYVVNEIFNSLLKKDNVSHISHFIGAICGIVFIFYPI